MGTKGEGAKDVRSQRKRRASESDDNAIYGQEKFNRTEQISFMSMHDVHGQQQQQQEYMVAKAYRPADICNIIDMDDNRHQL